MELSIADIKELLGCQSGSTRTHSIVVGEKYLIRSATLYQLGRIKAITDTDIVLSDASWVASVGRFGEALQSGVLDEVEPFAADCIVSRGAIVDATVWAHDLPRIEK